MKSLGKYQELERVGRGAMGVVYRGVDPWLQRAVAIKVMTADIEADDDLLSRFRREAQVAVQLRHPNIIEVYDGGVEQGRAYIAMEFLDGRDLKWVLSEGGSLSLERQFELVGQLCDALAYAHGQGVVHRDIKPGNIQITESGQVKILDFGLARIADSEMTATGMVFGTPNYMAPEQVEGERVDNRADIFAVATLFYEMLTGKKAFDAENMAAVLFAVTTRDPAPVHEVDPALPEELWPVLARALAKRPEDRYPTIDEFGDDLAAVEQLVAERKIALRRQVSGRMEELRTLRAEHGGGLELIAEVREAGGLPIAPAEQADDPTEGAVPRAVVQLADLEAPPEPDDYLGLVELDRTVGRMIEVSRPYLARLDLASRLLDEAAALESSGDDEPGLRNAGQVLGDFPWHPRARALQARLREALEAREVAASRRRRADELVSEGRELQQGGDLEAGLERMDRALELVSDHGTARRHRDELRDAIREQRERARHLETVVTEARALVETDLRRARERVKEVLSEDPEHVAAGDLLDRIDDEIARLEERAARKEQERRAREEAERRAREEAERKAREEAERKAREEAERKAREEAERKAREEAERKAREEAERKAREEAEREAALERTTVLDSLPEADVQPEPEAPTGEAEPDSSAPPPGPVRRRRGRGKVPWSAMAEKVAGGVGSTVARARELAAENPRTTAVVAAVALASILMIAVLRGGEEAHAPGSGVLLVDASPWARVVEIRNGSSGEAWPLDSGEPGGDAPVTPVRVPIDPGSWDVILEYGGQRRTVEAEVGPGEVWQRRVQMRIVDVDAFLEAARR